MPPRQMHNGRSATSNTNTAVAPGSGGAQNGSKQQQPRQQQPLPDAGGDDDMLSSEVPPAFPQPVSSLPRDHIHLYPEAALPVLGLPISSSSSSSVLQGVGSSSLPQQQPGQAWLASAAAHSGPDAAAAAGADAAASPASPQGVLSPQYEYADADGLPLPYGERARVLGVCVRVCAIA